MALKLRREKNTALTIDEMDGNLKYLEELAKKRAPYGISNKSGEYTYYDSLHEAVMSVGDGVVIQAFADYEETNASKEIPLNKNLNLNLNGYSYVFSPSDDTKSLFKLENNSDVLVNIYNGNISRILKNSGSGSKDSGNIFNIKDSSLFLTLNGVSMVSNNTFLYSDSKGKDYGIVIIGGILNQLEETENPVFSITNHEKKIKNSVESDIDLFDMKVFYLNSFIESRGVNIGLSGCVINPKSPDDGNFILDTDLDVSIINSEINGGNKKLIKCDYAFIENSLLYTGNSILECGGHRISNTIFYSNNNMDRSENIDIVSVSEDSFSDYYIKNSTFFGRGKFNSYLKVGGRVNIISNNSFYYNNELNNRYAILYENEGSWTLIGNIVKNYGSPSDNKSVMGLTAVSINMSGNYFELDIDEDTIINGLDVDIEEANFVIDDFGNVTPKKEEE
jgi:hypothetical protein